MSNEALRLALEALTGMSPFVATEVVESCNGNKCRERWCCGCSGEDEAQKAVSEAIDSLAKTRQAIAAIDAALAQSAPASPAVAVADLTDEFCAQLASEHTSHGAIDSASLIRSVHRGGREAAWSEFTQVMAASVLAVAEKVEREPVATSRMVKAEDLKRCIDDCVAAYSTIPGEWLKSLSQWALHRQIDALAATPPAQPAVSQAMLTDEKVAASGMQQGEGL